MSIGIPGSEWLDKKLIMIENVLGVNSSKIENKVTCEEVHDAPFHKPRIVSRPENIKKVPMVVKKTNNSKIFI